MKELLQRFGVTDTRLNRLAVGNFSEVFRSARVKLTVFYLATLLAFSLTLTIGIRMFAEYELNRAYMAQQGEFRELARNGLDLLIANPERIFRTAQDRHAAIARDHLNRDLVLLNLGALILGGLVSYWFAGRTLRPIADSHEAQARFVADASHELRTPLANIRSENEVFLRQKSFTTEETRELVQSNLEEVQRLENLSRDMLALTQYGQTELPKDPIKVSELVKEAVAQTKKAQMDKSVKVEQQIEDTFIYGNQESLVRLMVILLDNAVKYGPKSGTIYVAGARRGSQYVMTIRDEGQGIAPKDLPRIFDRLYRGDTSRTTVGAATAGYGLGLALATEIVQANQGSIRAYNSVQGGAVFSVQLPLVRART
jgi:signal transduction histidine kinase